ncbi:MAG: hypothetical protein ACFFFC_00360 [Candidatus Thorarchaeota archaeon]
MDKAIIAGLFNELIKIAEEGKITKEKLKRLARYGIPAAAGIGTGYAVGKAIGRPLKRSLMRLGVGPHAAKVLRYGIPTAAGVSAAYLLAEKALEDKLTGKISNDKS